MNVSVSKTPLSESAVDFPISSPFDVSSRHAALALRLALRADMALASLGLSGDDEVWRGESARYGGLGNHRRINGDASDPRRRCASAVAGPG
jgi:hypothetical protein